MKLRRILLSLFIITALVISTVKGTQALFSDADSVNGNTVTTARLSIDARAVINKPLGDLLLLPGTWGDPGTVDLYNDGNAPQRQWMYVENISGALCDYVQLKIGYSYAAANSFDVVFGTYSLSSLNGAANAREVGRSNPIQANITTRLVQQPYVDASTPNTLQASTCSWDEVFAATQPGYGITP